MKNFVSEILKPIVENTSKLEELYKQKESPILKGFSFSEMHCISAIQEIEKANLTRLAEALSLTKAGVSKTIKKLVEKKAITSYSLAENKKEIYYSLTSTGLRIYKAHLELHRIWCEKDQEFFKNYSEKENACLFGMLRDYSKFLAEKKKGLKNDKVL